MRDPISSGPHLVGNPAAEGLQANARSSSSLWISKPLIVVVFIISIVFMVQNIIIIITITAIINTGCNESLLRAGAEDGIRQDGRMLSREVGRWPCSRLLLLTWTSKVPEIIAHIPKQSFQRPLLWVLWRSR